MLHDEDNLPYNIIQHWYYVRCTRFSGSYLFSLLTSGMMTRSLGGYWVDLDTSGLLFVSLISSLNWCRCIVIIFVSLATPCNWIPCVHVLTGSIVCNNLDIIMLQKQLILKNLVFLLIYNTSAALGLVSLLKSGKFCLCLSYICLKSYQDDKTFRGLAKRQIEQFSIWFHLFIDEQIFFHFIFSMRMVHILRHNLDFCFQIRFISNSVVSVVSFHVLLYNKFLKIFTVLSLN